MYQTIRYEKQENIGILTINRPEALNALNSAVIGDLEQAITEVEKDAGLGALIITGEGRSFVAGADIGEQLPMDVASGRAYGLCLTSLHHPLGLRHPDEDLRQGLRRHQIIFDFSRHAVHLLWSFVFALFILSAFPAGCNRKAQRFPCRN